MRVDTLEVIDSSLGRRRLRFVLAWAELHQDELRENWKRARAGETPQPDRTTPMIGLTPDITEPSVIRHGVLRLTFADGLTGEIEVLDRVRGPVFEEARTLEGFARVTVDRETGTVTWRAAPISRLTRSMSASAPALGQDKTSRPDVRPPSRQAQCPFGV